MFQLFILFGHEYFMLPLLVPRINFSKGPTNFRLIYQNILNLVFSWTSTLKSSLNIIQPPYFYNSHHELLPFVNTHTCTLATSKCSQIKQCKCKKKVCSPPRLRLRWCRYVAVLTVISTWGLQRSISRERLSLSHVNSILEHHFPLIAVILKIVFPLRGGARVKRVEWWKNENVKKEPVTRSPKTTFHFKPM